MVDMASVGAYAFSMINILIMVVAGAMLIAVIGGATWFFLYNKQFKYRVIVYKRHRDKDGNEMPIILDVNERGGIVKDKKLKRYYFMLKKRRIRLGEEESKRFDENRDLDLPSIPCGRGGQMVFVEELGTRKYAMGQPFVFEGNVKIMITEADCAEQMRSYDMNAIFFKKKDMREILALIGFITVIGVTFALVIVLVQKFEVLPQATENLARAAEAIREATIASKSVAIASAAPG